jgi:uncharacterized membrane protein
MQPYVESGNSARKNLELSRHTATERRLMSSLRGFKQVINVIGAFAIVLIPLIGALANSSHAAAYVALNFLAVILMLELLERNVRRALRECRKAHPAQAV